MMISELFPSWPLISAFFVASIVLAVTPGPGVFYIVTRSVMQGRKAGLASVAGVALGNFGNAMGASLGLAAIFAISSLAFAAVKYAGAGYLIYLGVQTLRAPNADATVLVVKPTRVAKIFRDGFVVALLNPKTAIFFAAFLPQFMNPNGSAMLQSVMLGSLFVTIAAVTDTLYAVMAGTVAPKIANYRGVRAAGRYLTGTAFIGLGVFTALSGSKARGINTGRV